MEANGGLCPVEPGQFAHGRKKSAARISDIPSIKRIGVTEFLE